MRLLAVKLLQVASLRFINHDGRNSIQDVYGSEFLVFKWDATGKGSSQAVLNVSIRQFQLKSVARLQILDWVCKKGKRRQN